MPDPWHGAIQVTRKRAKDRTHGRKSRSTVTNVRTHRVPTLELKKRLQAREHELAEALAREEATAEVLRTIASPTINPELVLGAIAQSAARLLDVTDAEIMRSKVAGSGLSQSMGHQDSGR